MVEDDICELGIGMRATECLIDLVESSLRVNVFMPDCIEGRNGWCAGLGSHAMQQHGFALTAEVGHGVGGICESQLGMGVITRNINDPNFYVITRPQLVMSNVIGSHAAEGKQQHQFLLAFQLFR